MSILQRGASSINKALLYRVRLYRSRLYHGLCRVLCRSAWITLMLLLAAGCGLPSTGMDHSSHGQSDSEEHAAHSDMNEMTVDGLTISHAMAAEAPLQGGNGAVYMTLSSESADQFISAESPAAAMVELHESIDDNGVMRMEPRPDGFEIPASGAVELKRGGKHIMLMNLTNALEAGDEVEVTLHFREHASVTITVPVMAIGAMDHK